MLLKDTVFDPDIQYGIYRHYTQATADQFGEPPKDLVSLLKGKMRSFVPEELWHRISTCHTPANKRFTTDGDHPLERGAYGLKYEPTGINHA